MNVVVPTSIYGNRKKAQDERKIKIYWLDLLAALAGFCLGRSVLLKEIAPFGAAYLAIFLNLHPQRLVIIVLGVGLGAFFSQGWNGLGIILVTLVGVYLIRLGKNKLKHHLVKGSIIAGLALSFHLITYFFYLNDFYQLLMGILESLLIFCLSWLFLEGSSDLFAGWPLRLTKINLLTLLFLASALVIGLPTMDIWGVEITQVVILLGIIVFAYSGGITPGVVLGLFLGLALTLTEFYNPTIIAIYGFSGLIGGYFRNYGKLATILGLILVSLVFAGLEIVPFPILEILLQNLLVGAGFLLIPNSWLTKIKQLLPKTDELSVNEENYQLELQDSFTAKLQEFAQLFHELGATFKEVTAVEEIEKDDLSYFLYIISNRVCQDCHFKNHCWDKQFYQTYTQIFKLLSILESKGQASEEDFLRLLKGHCRNLSLLKNSIDGSLEIYQLHRYWNKLLKNQQAIVGDQLSEIARVIESFSEELDFCGTKREDLLKKRLEEEGLSYTSCRISGEEADQWLNISITKEPCLGEGECRQIFKIINQMIPQPMTNYECQCSRESGQGVCYLKFCPARNFRVKIGYHAQPKHGQEVLGDTLVYQQLKSGKFMAILSDGMGTGEEAARESKSATKLVQKIIRAGFDHELAVRTVNTALLSRSTDECFATLDISLIDLFNGEIELIKIGAAASFIKRGYDVNCIRGSSLPIGILENVEPASFKRRLLAEDFVIMMTDGVLDAVKIANKEDWLARLLRQCFFELPEDLARFIYEQAVGNGVPEDDMTVVVLKLEKENAE